MIQPIQPFARTFSLPLCGFVRHRSAYLWRLLRTAWIVPFGLSGFSFLASRTNRLIGETPTDDAFHRKVCTYSIINTNGIAGAVAEVKLSSITMKMGF